MRFRLRTELLLVIAIASALPLAAFATFAHLESRKALKDALLDRQARVADERAEVIARELVGLERAMHQSAVARPLSQSEPAEIQAQLTELYLRKDALSQVALLGPDGNVLQSLFVDDPGAFARVRPEFARHPVVSGLSVEAFLKQLSNLLQHADAGRTEVYGVTPSSPDSISLVSAKNPVTGERLALEVRLASLVKSLVGVSEDGLAVLLDPSGRVIAGAKASDTTYPMLTGAGALRTQSMDFEGKPHFAARATVRGTQLSVALLRSEEEALAPLANLTLATAGILAMTLLAAIIVGAMMARQLSRPISNLAESARQLAKGNLKHRMPSHRVPEIEEVASAFNQMADSLDAANARLVGFNEELKKQVAERTAELREAQAALLRSQRLGAVIDLTAGLAHELNNPLAAIIGTAQLLQMELPPKDPLQERLEPIVAEGLRISTLLKRITALSDWQKGNMAPAELHALIDQALAEHEEHINKQQAQVVRAFDPELPKVLADAPAITEVVGHLIDNAANALEGRPSRTIKVSTRALEGQAVRVEIADTGRGIPPEHLERIFNPFFSTSATGGTTGRGSGLSLARCHQVVEAHGGKLTVQSELGVGTTVALVLPAAPPRAELA